MTTMLTDLVAMVADEFTVLLPDAEPANDLDDRLVDRLWAAGLLDIPDLLALLLRRAEEERISAGLRAGLPAKKPRLLQSLVSDEDSDIAAAAMAVILAKSRRRDRFDGPRVTFDDIPAEGAVALANAVAAGRRADLSKRFEPSEADERLTNAVHALLSRHDEGIRLEAKLFELAHALNRAGRLDEAFIRSALDEGDIALLAEALGLTAGLTFACAWEHVTGGEGKLALLLRMSGASRPLAGEVIARAAEVLGLVAESEIGAFDVLTDEEVGCARKWLRLDPAYRSSVADLASANGQHSI